ncbi:DNA-packaging protein [Geosporobacter ferrireducens]|uniref:DNA-packaging protein n=1 Tax=Geosporobacter ferrireducens TaxID=1424294 RepID=UPI00139BE4A5|nr:DNA-packaging protein [Geosporobacter ferrireducens]MTI56152.1 DNA-packaging protein [Geosporobacter ferrireducens]
MTSTDVWNIVKLRLGLQDDTLQPLIDTYIEEIENRILHYCKIRSVPFALKFTWASMVIDAVRVDLPNIAEISDTVGGGENIKIGDTSVSPANSGVSNVSKASIDEVVLNYKVDLNRYRKLRW